MENKHTVRELLEIICSFNKTETVEIDYIQQQGYIGTAEILLQSVADATLDEIPQRFYPDASFSRTEHRAPRFMIEINDL